MPDTYTPVSVDQVLTRSGAACWRVIYDKPDGTQHLHLFPLDTLEWRAAELELDLDADREQLLDVVLHEPYVQPESAGAARSLLTADTLAEHRTAHLARIAAAKQRVTIGRHRGGKDPLDVIRAHPLDPAGVAAKRRAVEEARVRHRRTGAPQGGER